MPESCLIFRWGTIDDADDEAGDDAATLHSNPKACQRGRRCVVRFVSFFLFPVADFGGCFSLPWPGVIRLSLALERRPQLSPGCMDLFVYIVVLFLMLLPLLLPNLRPCPFPFQHAAMRLQIEQKLPVSVAVVVAALAVAAGKCEHFGQHSQVVAGELLAQKVLVMMILNYS